jgi:hypothetical protein
MMIKEAKYAATESKEIEFNWGSCIWEDDISCMIQTTREGSIKHFLFPALIFIVYYKN